MVKDLIYMRRQVKTLGILLVFYIVLFSTMNDTSQFVSMITMIMVLMCSILIMNTFAYDELSKWDIYSLSLPITKFQLVLCKYLLTVSLSGVGVVLSIAFAVSKNALNVETWLGFYVAFGAAMLFSSILIPLLYKFGVQRARILLVCVLMLPTFGIFFFKKLNIPMPSLAALDFVLKISPVILVALVALSLTISYQVFKNKEV